MRLASGMGTLNASPAAEADVLIAELNLEASRLMAFLGNESAIGLVHGRSE